MNGLKYILNTTYFFTIFFEVPLPTIFCAYLVMFAFVVVYVQPQPLNVEICIFREYRCLNRFLKGKSKSASIEIEELYKLLVQKAVAHQARPARRVWAGGSAACGWSAATPQWSNQPIGGEHHTQPSCLPLSCGAPGRWLGSRDMELTAQTLDELHKMPGC